MIYQAACVPRGNAIISFPEARYFGTKVNDQSQMINKEVQSIFTLDGFSIPSMFVNGLPCMKICPFTDNDGELFNLYSPQQIMSGNHAYWTMILKEISLMFH